ncbi:MAG: RNA polymerase sigma factor [Spirochaetales bacterium]|nr:RNA polymerase sigma factor [Spirochaetales bacterium]
MPEELNNDSTDTQEQARFNSKQVLELVKRCGSGEAPALSEFFELFAQDIYNFPIRVFHLDGDQASDYFIYAYERLKDGQRFRTFRGKSSFRTWFYTVLRNLVIDWMRTVRDIQIVPSTFRDEDGRELSGIENTPDPRSEREGIQDWIDQFAQNLSRIPVEQRVVFKLTYVYYLHLEADELAYLAERSGLRAAEIMTCIAKERDELSGREMANIAEEDKITALYMNLIELRSRRDKLLQNQSNPTLSYELELLDQAMEKKRKQRDRLLERRDKGLFVVRAPYRFITGLLGIPEGSISVIMMKVSEQLSSHLMEASA